MNPIRVILADDHQLILDGVKALLADNPQIEIAALAENGARLLELCRLLKPDLVLTDVDMPVMNGHDAVKQLRIEFPEIKILVLTMHKDWSLYQRMKAAGANGYIHKNTDREEMLFAIRRIMSGKEYTSDEIRAETNFTSQQTSVQEEMLTVRETEILIEIAMGFTNAEIGKKLHISDRTVDTHRTNLMRKLGVNNVAGLVRYAYTNKLIT